jgi:3-dehydroquinate synthase
MPELQVDVPQKKVTYPLKNKKGILNRVGSEVSAIFKGQKIALISDETVYQHYGEKTVHQLKDAGYAVQSIVLPPGEQTKTFDSMPAIYSKLLEFGLTRSDCILALGGGVVGDIAGFVAASFLRGITFIQVPTTLLAQVDSSVGGKVGVDLPEGKNLVGAFYHPKLVLIDPLVLETLTNENFSDGMAEVIKYGCIKDKNFFQKLSELHSREEVMEEIEAIIDTCCAIKRDVVEADEKDKGERMLLNFGHTLGHAIEAYYHYERYSHGQGVAIGMATISKLSEERGLSPKGTTEAIISCLKTHGLPIDLDQKEDYPDILPYIKRDKKNLDGTLHVIVLDEMGQARTKQTTHTFFDSLTEGEVRVD